MYIINDIAYAGEKEKPIKIISLRPLDNYRLWLRFSTGETKIFDCKQLLDSPAFQRLRDITVFNGVYIDYGIPVWCDGEIDYCPHTIYKNSILVGE